MVLSSFQHLKRQIRDYWVTSTIISIDCGAVGIGVHSLDLLQSTLTTLYPATQSSAAVTAAAATASTNSAASVIGAATATNATPAAFAAIPSMAGETALNPNAAWFAAASVVIKEWLYRKSKFYLINVTT